MNPFIKVIALLLTLQVAYVQSLNRNEENRLVQEFISRVDTLNGVTYERSLTLMKNTFQSTLRQIPAAHQGTASALLRKFVEDATRVEHNSSSAEKKAVLDSFEGIMQQAAPRPGARPSQEAPIIGMQLFPMLFAVKAIDSERANQVTSAANDLKSKLSSEGIARNQRLFNLLRNFENDKDNGDKYLVDIAALKE